MTAIGVDFVAPALVRRREMIDTQMSPDQFGVAFRHLRGGHCIDRSRILTAREHIVAIARAAQGEPVVAGMAAAVMHGSEWFDAEFVVELIRKPTGSGRPASGSTTRRLDLDPADVSTVDGIAVTSPLRTAFDLARMGPPWRGLGYVDMLARAVPIDRGQLVRYSEAQRRVRHVRQARELALLMDARSESPPESWLRHLMFTADLPTPDLQIGVRDELGDVFARIDLGYEELKIGIEYDGEEFHSASGQKARDTRRDARLGGLGWSMIRVDRSRLRENPFGVVVEIDKALKSRGGYH